MTHKYGTKIDQTMHLLIIKLMCVVHRQNYRIGTAQKMSVDTYATQDLLLLIQQNLRMAQYQYGSLSCTYSLLKMYCFVCDYVLMSQKLLYPLVYAPRNKWLEIMRS